MKETALIKENFKSMQKENYLREVMWGSGWNFMYTCGGFMSMYCKLIQYCSKKIKTKNKNYLVPEAGNWLAIWKQIKMNQYHSAHQYKFH